ncbi:carboxypeptidase regulatory-like domain-containing protein, partial [Terriglobus sp. YAF25]
MTGVVSDATGSVLPNAQITATNPSTGLSRTTTTDTSGNYQFTDLPPGTYDITFSAPNFTQSVSKGVAVSANQTRRIDTTMSLGAVSDKIEVTTAPPALQTDRADVNYEITSTQVQELPTTSTAGRNFQGLYRLIPGVPPPTENNSQAGNPGRTQAVTANGIANTINSTKIDGAAVGYPWLQSIVAYIPPTDSIESANIVTNSFNAEQGAAGGIAANLIVKSGTNNFHGSAWEYNSISQFNARQYFTRVSTTPVTPKNILNEYGANIGGPIIKDKL